MTEADIGTRLPEDYRLFLLRVNGGSIPEWAHYRYKGLSPDGQTPHRGKVYRWDHDEPPAEDVWNGELETADDIWPLAASFADSLRDFGRGQEDDDW
jgi:hypothetical protein